MKKETPVSFSESETRKRDARSRMSATATTAQNLSKTSPLLAPAVVAAYAAYRYFWSTEVEVYGRKRDLRNWELIFHTYLVLICSVCADVNVILTTATRYKSELADGCQKISGANKLLSSSSSVACESNLPEWPALSISRSSRFRFLQHLHCWSSKDSLIKSGRLPSTELTLDGQPMDGRISCTGQPHNKKDISHLIGPLVIASTVYHVWKERNRRVFQNTMSRLLPALSSMFGAMEGILDTIPWPPAQRRSIKPPRAMHKNELFGFRYPVLAEKPEWWWEDTGIR
uniref:Uncharacterized protein n=1 Tax=Salix viminalis TaxID=40686 RepID=A0A6N2KYM5_SALVM